MENVTTDHCAAIIVITPDGILKEDIVTTTIFEQAREIDDIYERMDILSEYCRRDGWTEAEKHSNFYEYNSAMQWERPQMGCPFNNTAMEINRRKMHNKIIKADTRSSNCTEANTRRPYLMAAPPFQRTRFEDLKMHMELPGIVTSDC
jgi:hypothetical protein